MRRAWDDLELDMSVHVPHRVAIHVDDRFVVAADDEQRRCLDARQRVTRQVGSSAA
jgi:hypothetical protein